MPCPVEALQPVPHVLEKIFGVYLHRKDDFLTCLMVNTAWKTVLGDLGKRLADIEEKSFLHDWFEKEVDPLKFEVQEYVGAAFLACNAKWLFLSVHKDIDEYRDVFKDFC